MAVGASHFFTLFEPAFASGIYLSLPNALARGTPCGTRAGDRRQGERVRRRVHRDTRGESSSGTSVFGAREGGEGSGTGSAMVATRRRATRDASNAKKPLKDVSNGDAATATKLPRKIPGTGPSTAPPAAAVVARNTRSSRKKPVANVGRTRTGPVAHDADASEEATEPVRLEAKFERAAKEEPAKKKRKALEAIEIDVNDRAPGPRRVTRARTRKNDGDARHTPAVDLTCDERLVAERGFVLASADEVGAAEDVYPFSTSGGRRANERRHALTPYVENGHLFSAAMRQDLVDWMSCQHGMLELADETFHLALRYLDTFLLRRGPENFLARNGAGSEPVPALPLGALPCDRALYLDGSHQPLCNKLKRLGITCVFVAAKVVEVCAPPAGEFAHAAEVSTFSRSQLLLAERALLRELEYDLYHPTCSSFAAAYVSAAAATVAKDARVFNKKHKMYETETDPVRQTAEVVEYVLEASAVARDGVAFAPSRLAAAAVGWTLARFFALTWADVPELRKVSGYAETDLAPVLSFLDKVVADFRAAGARRTRGGFFADEKHARAARAVWQSPLKTAMRAATAQARVSYDQ